MGDSSEVKRYCRADLEKRVAEHFKDLLKEPCSECSKPALKPYSKSMPFVLSQMLDVFWCPLCGRILCQNHRHQHRCEQYDLQMERKKNLTHEQLQQQLREQETRAEAEEEARAVKAREEADAVDQERSVRRERRKLMAAKASAIEGWLQSVGRDTNSMALRGPRFRDEVLELYSQSRRIALYLMNEFLHPSCQALPDDEWAQLKDIYTRARELIGLQLLWDGGPLSLELPWDVPQPDDAATS